MTKKIEFYKLFRHPNTPVTLYATKFKSIHKELLYNGISYPPEDTCTQFINNLGAYFTTIRNTDPLPIKWQCQTIDALIIVARK